MRVLIENTPGSGMVCPQQKNDDRLLFDMVSAPLDHFASRFIMRLGLIRYLLYGITMNTYRMVTSVVAE